MVRKVSPVEVQLAKVMSSKKGFCVQGGRRGLRRAKGRSCRVRPGLGLSFPPPCRHPGLWCARLVLLGRRRAKFDCQALFGKLWRVGQCCGGDDCPRRFGRVLGTGLQARSAAQLQTKCVAHEPCTVRVGGRSAKWHVRLGLLAPLAFVAPGLATLAIHGGLTLQASVARGPSEFAHLDTNADGIGGGEAVVNCLAEILDEGWLATKGA